MQQQFLAVGRAGGRQFLAGTNRLEARWRRAKLSPPKAPCTCPLSPPGPATYAPTTYGPSAPVQLPVQSPILSTLLSSLLAPPTPSPAPAAPSAAPAFPFPPPSPDDPPVYRPPMGTPAPAPAPSRAPAYPPSPAPAPGLTEARPGLWPDPGAPGSAWEPEATPASGSAPATAWRARALAAPEPEPEPEPPADWLAAATTPLLEADAQAEHHQDDEDEAGCPPTGLARGCVRQHSASSTTTLMPPRTHRIRFGSHNSFGSSSSSSSSSSSVSDSDSTLEASPGLQVAAPPTDPQEGPSNLVASSEYVAPTAAMLDVVSVAHAESAVGSRACAGAPAQAEAAASAPDGAAAGGASEQVCLGCCPARWRLCCAPTAFGPTPSPKGLN